MPNQPKTPTRTIRVAPQIWSDAKAQAAEDNRTLTSVLVEFLIDYGAGQRS